MGLSIAGRLLFAGAVLANSYSSTQLIKACSKEYEDT